MPLQTKQSKEPPVAVSAASVALAAWYTDPINRFYRYPLCNLLVRPLLATPLTPNHVTVIHVSVALLSAYFVTRGTPTDLVIAALLYEVRNVLDCLDGVLARARKTASLHGAVIDELADAAGFIALNVACGIYLYQTGMGMLAVWSSIVVFTLSVLMAMSYVFQKNRFHAPLATGINEVELKLHERWNDVKTSGGAFFPRFVFFIEMGQNAVAMPGQFRRLMRTLKHDSPLDRRETTYLISRANDPWLKALMLLLSFTTGETVILILMAGLLFNDVWGAYQAIVLFSVIGFSLVSAWTNLYVRKAYQRSNP